MNYFFRKDLIKKNENKILVERKKNTLALNESPFSFLNLLSEEEKQRILNSQINKYPTQEFLDEFYKQIMDYCNLKSSEQILIGNGIDELFYFLFISINEKKNAKNSKCVINVPTYPDYKNYGQSVGLSFIEIPLLVKEIEQKDNQQDNMAQYSKKQISEMRINKEQIDNTPKISEKIDKKESEVSFQLDVNKIIKAGKRKDVKGIIFTNPNNPTGTVFPISDIIYITEKLEDKLIMVDEAYIEFCPKYTLVPLIDEFPNLIILRTFSKGFLSPGLRLGYLVSNSSIIAQLKKVFPVFTVSQISIEIGKILLENHQKIKNIIENIIENREKIYNKLCQYIETGQLKNVYKSNTNFVLFQFNSENLMNKFYDFLLKSDISVRNVSSKFLKNALRVTASNDLNSEDFINKVEQFFQQVGLPN